MSLQNSRPRIFVITDHYLPGHTSAGPVQTLANVIAALNEEFDFYILTRDCDTQDAAAYPGIVSNAWNSREKTRVFYASHLGISCILQALATGSPDLIYLNSFFSRFSILFLTLRRLGRTPKVPVLIGPRGEFSGSALHLKSLRKRLYIEMAAKTGMLDGILWHGSGVPERADIQWVVSGAGLDEAKIFVAPDLIFQHESSEQSVSAVPKRKGAARLVFLSRVVPMKNLEFALELLGEVSGEVSLDLYGPIESVSYWTKCQSLIARLARNVQVTYHGEVPHAKVRQTIAGYDFFILSTLGENFGHVILESMHAGVPPLISDRTQWQNLKQLGVGWELPLSKPTWVRVLQQCVDMTADEHADMRERAYRYSLEWINSPALKTKNGDLFRSVLAAKT
jgi:glycosyltransferase involved in cell wall biosynthesis